MFRKISYFGDKEGKTRVIAILDYWSQCALRGLHDSLNGVLKSLECDCTFDQGRFLKVLPRGDVTYHSIDLSAATDRMPVSLQKRVIGLLFADQLKADAWARILTAFPFVNKDHNGPIHYAVGQPMGAYSS